MNVSITPIEENIKLRIIQHARDQFFTSGFSKVTMDELSADLGISKKTMYQYFHSKDDLVNAVVDWQIMSVKRQISEIMHGSTDFVDRIYNMWSIMGKMICQVGKQFHDDIRRFRPDLWKRINEHRQNAILANFSKMIDQGVQNGFVRNDVHKEILVLIYLGAIQSIINPEVICQHSFSTEDAYKTVLQVYFDGILTTSARQHFHKRISQHSY